MAYFPKISYSKPIRKGKLPKPITFVQNYAETWFDIDLLILSGVYNAESESGSEDSLSGEPTMAVVRNCK